VGGQKISFFSLYFFLGGGLYTTHRLSYKKALKKSEIGLGLSHYFFLSTRDYPEKN
jgi:hypothetical protein